MVEGRGASGQWLGYAERTSSSVEIGNLASTGRIR